MHYPTILAALIASATFVSASPSIRTLTRRPEIYTPQCPATCELDMKGTQGCFGKISLDGACTQPNRQIAVNVDACKGMTVHLRMDGGGKEKAIGRLEVIGGDGNKEVFGVNDCKLRLIGKPPLGDRCLFQRETCVVMSVQ